GLALTLALARHEVPVILLDEDDHADEPGHPERTVVLRPRTADLLYRLGYTAVYADAARWTAWRTLRRRQETEYVRFEAETEASDGSRLPAIRSSDERGAPGRTVAKRPGNRTDRPAGPPPPDTAPLHLTQDRLCAGLRTALAGQDLVTVAQAGRLDRMEQ